MTREFSETDHWKSWSRCLAATTVASAVMAPPFGIAQQKDVWRYNGVQLKAALQGDFAPEAAEGDLRRTLSSAKAIAYISGVADATEGVKWCSGGEGVLAHEFADRVFTYLSRLPVERLQGNAAILVDEALAQSFPCKGR